MQAQMAHLSHFVGDTLTSSSNMMMSQLGWWLDLSCAHPGLMRRSSSLSQASVAGQARFRLAPCTKAGRLERLDIATAPGTAGRAPLLRRRMVVSKCCNAGAPATGYLQQGNETALGTSAAQHEPNESGGLVPGCPHESIHTPTSKRHAVAHGELVHMGDHAESRHLQAPLAGQAPCALSSLHRC